MSFSRQHPHRLDSRLIPPLDRREWLRTTLGGLSTRAYRGARRHSPRLPKRLFAIIVRQRVR